MTTDPGNDVPKTTECPYCKEAFGAEHKKTCGLWSPYSTSKWVKPDKPVTVWPWPFPQEDEYREAVRRNWL